jgi:hypothetical protein
MDVLGVLSKSTEAKMGGKDFSSLLLQVLNIGRARPNRATFAHAGCFDLPGWATPDQRCKVLDENSVRQLSTGRKMKATSASLLEVSRQFLASPNAVVSVGKMRIKMSPMPVPVTGLDSQYSRKSGLVILPQPYCLLSGTADNVSRLDFSADVFILESNGRFSASESKLTGFWRLKRSGANWQHTLQADPMFSIFTFKMSESRAAELRDKGSEVSLGKCSGNEDEILLHELEKNLN